MEQVGAMRFGYMIVYVTDVPATLDFYERAFGLKRRFPHEIGTYGEMETGSTVLAFASESSIDFKTRTNRAYKDPAAAEIGLICDDVAAAFSRAIFEGATPYLHPVAKPWGQTVSYVRDNNGFLVEICSPVTA
jgi:catechol 2,3-dioxygenase-like lactoylglutathione lyase family enzyme